MMRLAFIHIMRTGGSYVVEQLMAAGLTPHCPWNKQLGRDWNRAELFTLFAQPSGLIPNHVINWDNETLAAAKAAGWRTFTVVRDPCEQLPSLWSFLGKPGDLDAFILDQLHGRSFSDQQHHISWRCWAIPWWWPHIDVIIPYKASLHSSLCRALGVHTRECAGWNCSDNKATPATETLEAIRQSVYYHTYREVIECASSRMTGN